MLVPRKNSRTTISDRVKWQQDTRSANLPKPQIAVCGAPNVRVPRGTTTWQHTKLLPQPRHFQSPIVHISSPSDNKHSFGCGVFCNVHGQKRNYRPNRRGGCAVWPPTTTNLKGVETEPQPYYESVQVRFPAETFNDPTLHNGFPFVLEADNEYLSCISNPTPGQQNITSEYGGESLKRNHFISNGPAIGYGTVSGIKVDNSNYTASVLNGGYNLTANQNYYKRGNNPREVVSNNFWNLACIEVDFVIETLKAPAGYITGYCFDSEGSSQAGLQRVSMDYEVVNSFNEEGYPPHLRPYRENTGELNIAQNFDSKHVIDGSGRDYSSIWIHGDEVDTYDCSMYLPLTIQPENTGAFLITFDSGVAQKVSEHPHYSNNVSGFNCNMMFDYGFLHLDHEGYNRNPIEYNSFVNKAYIVPADGWEFKIIGSKVKGVYYEYPFNPQEREHGDFEQDLNARFQEGNQPLVFTHSTHAPTEFGGFSYVYNDMPLNYLIFEPDLGNASRSGGDIYETISQSKNFIRPKDQVLSYQKYTTEGNIYSITSQQNGSTFYAKQRNELVLSDLSLDLFYVDFYSEDPLDGFFKPATISAVMGTRTTASSFAIPYSMRGGKLPPFYEQNPRTAHYEGRRRLSNPLQLKAISRDRYIYHKTRDVMPDTLSDLLGGSRIINSSALFPELLFAQNAIPQRTLRLGATKL